MYIYICLKPKNWVVCSRKPEGNLDFQGLGTKPKA